MRARGDGSSLIAAPARRPAKATMLLERCFRGTTRLGLARAYFRAGTTIARQPYVDRKIQRKTGDHGHSNYAENHKPLRGRGQSLFDAGRGRRVRSPRQRHTARDGSGDSSVRLVPPPRRATKAYASPQGQGISGNFAFDSPPLNYPTGEYRNGINLAEFILNNSFQGSGAQETLDISCGQCPDCLLDERGRWVERRVFAARCLTVRQQAAQAEYGLGRRFSLRMRQLHFAGESAAAPQPCVSAPARL